MKIGDTVKIKNVKNSPIGIVIGKSKSFDKDYIVEFHDNGTRVKKWTQEFCENELIYHLQQTDTRQIIISEDPVVVELANLFGDIVISKNYKIKYEKMFWGETIISNQSFFAKDLEKFLGENLYIDNCNIVLNEENPYDSFLNQKITFNNCSVIINPDLIKMPIR